MMETTDLRNGDDGAVGWWCDETGYRRVLGQRQMRPRSLVIRAIAQEEPAQARLIEHDHVIETLATSASYESLDEGILPRRPWGCEQFFDRHRPRRACQAVERMIAIVQQEARRLVPRKRLAQLLSRPRRRWVGGDRNVPDPSPERREGSRSTSLCRKYVDGAIGNTRQIGSTPYLVR
jgi:hypothetical protein